MKDILDRIADSSPNESSHELICRLRDCALEIEALRAAARKQAPAVEAWSEPCASCKTPRACQYDGCRSDEAPAVEAESEATLLLREIVNSLPSNKDWLDPVTERAARALLAAMPKVPAAESQSAWIVARETASEVGNGCKELTYAIPMNSRLWGSFEEAVMAIEELELPIGWVAIEVSRLVLDTVRARASEAAAGELIYQARQHSDEEDRWDDVQEATYLVCAAEPRFYKTRIVYAAPQPASEQQCDYLDTLTAVLNAIGYTEEFAARHPDLKVSEGVKLFLALQKGGIECQAHIGPDCTECGGTGVWTGEQQAAGGLSDDARECLMDVVSHHANIVAGFALQRKWSEDANDGDNALYWKREIEVAHRMKEQAERALAAKGDGHE